MTTDSNWLNGLIHELATWTIRTQTEDQMQLDLADVFGRCGLTFEREKRLSARDTIDFLFGMIGVPNIGVECKIAGSKHAVLRQLSRYAESKLVDQLLLITTRANHKQLHGITVQGKSIFVYRINNL